MNVTIEFSQPYQRFQVQNAFNNVLVLPANALVEVRNQSRYTELMNDIDAKLDVVEIVRVTGFADKVELAQFINSIPNATFGRISRMTMA